MHAKDLLLELLKIPSYSKREDAMADFILKFAKEAGHDAEMDGKNVIINASNEFVVATHMDTIEREMAIKARGNKIYGRGASDAKASIASILLFINKARKLNFTIAFLSDEEEDATGSKHFVEKYKAKEAIIMEPTSLKICPYHAGSIEVYFEVESKESHGSFCNGAINKAIKMIEELHEMPYWENGKYFDSCLVVQEIKSVNPYYLNPEKCNGRIEARLLPGQNAKEIAKEMKRVMEKYGNAKFTEIWNGFEINEGDDLIKKARKACEKAKIPFSLDGMPSWTDAIIFNEAGVKSIVFGPGNLKSSHTNEEYVEIEEIEKASLFLHALNEIME